VRYEFVYRHRREYPVRLCCRVLGVSCSGYYAFLKRPKETSTQSQILAHIREIHRWSRYSYGSRRIMHQLRWEGMIIGRYRVRRLMRLAGVQVRKRRRYKITTQSHHQYPVSPNLIQRCFTVPQPNMVWVSDITYIRTIEGWSYLAIVMDLYSRKIVGWSIARHMKTELVENALMMAIGRRRPQSGLIHHSDRGIQYACYEYRRLLERHGMISSMSRSGDCLDNAVAERFFATLKTECLLNWKEMIYQEVKRDIVDYIEMFYNSQRLHSHNGYLSPCDFEKLKVAS
jgi:putative transposase